MGLHFVLQCMLVCVIVALLQCRLDHYYAVLAVCGSSDFHILLILSIDSVLIHPVGLKQIDHDIRK